MSIRPDGLPRSAIVHHSGRTELDASDWRELGNVLLARAPDVHVRAREWEVVFPNVGLASRRGVEAHYAAFAAKPFPWLPPGASDPIAAIYIGGPPKISMIGQTRARIRLLLGRADGASSGGNNGGGGGGGGNHNLGININPIRYYERGLMFVDQAMHAEPWWNQKNTSDYDRDPPPAVDANGYPTQMPALGWYATSFGVGVADLPAGRWVVTYDGQGTIECGWDASQVSSTNGELVMNVNPTGQGVQLRITAITQGNHPRNIRIIPDLYAGMTWHPKYVEKIAGFTILRFMQNCGLWSLLKDWSERTPATFFGQQRGWENKKPIGSFAPYWITSDDMKGMAIEHMVDLCNQNQSDLHFCVPLTASNDYVTQAVTLILNRLDPERKLYLEAGNEEWNGVFFRHWALRAQGLVEAWDNPNWSQFSLARPSPRRYGAMAWDSERMLHFGGSIGVSSHSAQTHLFEWDETAQAIIWKLQSPVTSPTARSSHAMAWDPARRRVLLFGGQDGVGELGDTWEWNPDTRNWTQLSPATSPPARAGAKMVYDHVRQRMVLFGGFDGTNSAGDTWEYDGTTWAQVATTGPAARQQHGMVFDDARGVAVLFGGFEQTTVFGDTWEWNGTAWTQVAATGPAARDSMAMVYDGSIRMFGGRAVGGADLGDTWLYRPGTGWVQLSPSTSPSARSAMSCAVIADASKFVVLGGEISSVLTDEHHEFVGDYFEATAKAYARRHQQVMTLAEAVFPAARLVRVFSWQAANSYYAGVGLSHDQCAAHTDVVQIAPYMGTDANGNQIDTSGTADDIIDRLVPDVARALTRIEDYQTLLESFPGIDLGFYEWGQHVVALQAGHQPAVEEAMNHLRMETEVYDPFLAGARQRLGEEAPMCHFELIQKWGTAGNWGLWQEVTAPLNQSARYRSIEKVLTE